MFKDIESAFEKFCVMTIDGNLSDNEAFNLLKNKMSTQLFNLLQVKVYQANKQLSKK